MAIAAVILVVFLMGLSLAAPFLGGVQNVIGLLIIGFALWEAWKINRRKPLPITGSVFKWARAEFELDRGDVANTFGLPAMWHRASRDHAVVPELWPAGSFATAF